MAELIADFKREVVNLQPQIKDLRHFGWLVGGITLFLVAWLTYGEKVNLIEQVLIAAAVGLLVGSIWPLSLKHPYKVWMAIGFCLGAVMSLIILTSLFYLVISPISLIRQLVSGKNKVFNPPPASSYWQSKPVINYQKAMEEMS